MTEEQSLQAERIRRARMANDAHPFIAEWYKFEKNRVTSCSRTDASIIECPTKAIEYQQYLRALESMWNECTMAIEAVKPEVE